MDRRDARYLDLGVVHDHHVGSGGQQQLGRRRTHPRCSTDDRASNASPARLYESLREQAVGEATAP